MATKIEIINSALAKIKGRLITSIDDNSTEARLVKTLYDAIVNRLLSEIAPVFARKWYDLASLVETPVNGYTYVFQIPSDVIRILESDRYFDENWAQEDGKIYSNESTFKIECIYKVLDAEKFDPVFAEAVAYALAAELAVPLTNGAKTAEILEAKAEALLRRARSISAQGRGSVVQPEAGDWLTAKRF